MASLIPPQFHVGEEVVVKGSYTEDGRKVTFGALGLVHELRFSFKRGWRYAVELHDCEVK